jgi:hypothetical protein
MWRSDSTRRKSRFVESGQKAKVIDERDRRVLRAEREPEFVTAALDTAALCVPAQRNHRPGPIARR